MGDTASSQTCWWSQIAWKVQRSWEISFQDRGLLKKNHYQGPSYTEELFFPEVTEDTFCLKGRSTIVLCMLARVVLLLLFLSELKIWLRNILLAWFLKATHTSLNLNFSTWHRGKCLPKEEGARTMLQSYKHLQRRKPMKHVCFTEGAQDRGWEKLFVAWKDRSSFSRGRWGRGCKVVTEKDEMSKGWKSPDAMWLWTALEIPPLKKGWELNNIILHCEQGQTSSPPASSQHLLLGYKL